MEYNNTLAPLENFVSSLTFSVVHKFTLSAEHNDGATHDVFSFTICNELNFSDFKKRINTDKKNIIEVVSKGMSKNISKKEILRLIIQTEKLLTRLFNGDMYIGLSKVDKGLDLSAIDSYQEGALEYAAQTNDFVPHEYFTMVVKNTLQSISEDLSELLLPTIDKPLEKLEWYVKPSILAALLEELDTMGWIAPKKFHGETSFEKLAEVCDNIFIFNGTKNSLRNALSNNTMNKQKRSLISLPPLKDIMN